MLEKNGGPTLRRRAGLGIVSLLAGGVLFAFPATAGAQTGPASPPIGAYTATHAWHFVSAWTLHPPKLATDHTTETAKLAKGDFLLASFPNIDKPGPMDGQSGPLILNDKLQPVWFHRLPTNVVAMDLQEETYEGRPVLTWWQGVLTDSGVILNTTIRGKVVVVNEHYEKVATLVGKDGWIISPHDVAISGHDAWVTSYKFLKGLDLSTYGGARDGTLYDFAVQEYDLQTGKLLYTWDAYTHVSPSESYQTPSTSATVPWDAYHGNSVQLVGNGELLVSLRNTWATYLVDIKTGDIVWTLGGKDSTFSIPSKARFEWQHDVRLNPGGVVTVFNDNCCEFAPNGTFGPPGGPAAGLVLKLHPKTRTVTVVHAYRHGAGFDVAFEGSVQPLPNGNVLVGWGSQPYLSEYSRAGKLLLDASFPGKDESYRALYTGNWVGMPASPPDGVARMLHGKMTVYASWNGATRVKAWRLFAGENRTHLTAIDTKTVRSFETAFPVRASYKEFKVQALGSRGQVLGASGIFHVTTPLTTY